jgi:hypothetical protein
VDLPGAGATFFTVQAFACQGKLMGPLVLRSR